MIEYIVCVMGMNLKDYDWLYNFLFIFKKKTNKSFSS